MIDILSILLLLLSISASLIVYLYLYNISKRKKNNSPIIPEPPSYPIIGHVLDFGVITN